jgi:hypothetical protein
MNGIISVREVRRYDFQVLLSFVYHKAPLLEVPPKKSSAKFSKKNPAAVLGREVSQAAFEHSQ